MSEKKGPKPEAHTITVHTMRIDGQNLVINEDARIPMKQLRNCGIIVAAIGEGTKLEVQSLPRIGTNRRVITGIKLLPPPHRSGHSTTDLSFIGSRELRHTAAA